jgi:hypothetical protein
MTSAVTGAATAPGEGDSVRRSWAGACLGRRGLCLVQGHQNVSEARA